MAATRCAGTPRVNLARILYDAYPDSDLLPIDPETHCRDLRTLMELVASTDIGDGLFRFLVVEMVEGGEYTLRGAVRVVRSALDQVGAVLDGLVAVREEAGLHAVDLSRSGIKKGLAGLRRGNQRDPRRPHSWPGQSPRQ